LLSLFLLPWFNRKLFVPVCLALHATKAEKEEICRRHSGALFMLGILCLLYGFIPGLLVLLLVFIYLAVQAKKAKNEAARHDHAKAFFMLGLACLLCIFVLGMGFLASPDFVLKFLAPAFELLLQLSTATFAALAYSHYCLEALRQLRGGALVSLQGVEVIRQKGEEIRSSAA
jgi:Na+/proline symporter